MIECEVAFGAPAHLRPIEDILRLLANWGLVKNPDTFLHHFWDEIQDSPGLNFGRTDTHRRRRLSRASLRSGYTQGDMPEPPFTAAVTLGAVSGMRSMMAPAVISWAARRNGLDLESTPFSAFKGPGIGRTAAALALGELVADKMPFIPNRTNDMALLTRAVSGGAAGAALFKARRHSMIVGGLVGAAAAVGAAYATFYLRKKAAQYFDVSDRAVALVEDGLALTAGLIAISMSKPEKVHEVPGE